MRFKSVMPIFRMRSSCPGLVGTRRASMPPFRQRSAAAASTPSGAPPIPITAWTLVRRTAAEMPAERSPSPISLMRAPALRMSAISFSWRGRSRTMTTRSSTSRPSGAEVRPLERVDRDVDREIVGTAAPDLLTDEEHGRLVALALADDDRAPHGDRVHLLAHRLGRHLVGVPAVALPHGPGAGNGRHLAHAQEVPRQPLDVHRHGAPPEPRRAHFVLPA